MNTQNNLHALLQLLQSAKNTIVLTGAGISTLSGIPDYRGNTKLHSKGTSHQSFFNKPEDFYFHRDFLYPDDNYEPNIAHTTLAELARKNIVKKIYTQNIDWLHARANTPNVYALHGSAQRHYCTNPRCSKEYPYGFVLEKVNELKIPKCPACKFLIRPDIVFFSENLSAPLLNQAKEDFEKSDLVIVIGSSLSVTPVATLPSLGKKHIVIINAQPTYLHQDPRTILSFDDIEEVFTYLHKNLAHL